ncbi:PIR protein [Plasmodium brasilianum]|uniref:PIR protein n=2 Tax=Plasmodium (Plasmodium) TaxID=418103 RepID=A0A1D3RJJ4_PLAMA|nr:PIR protein [Plasmodium malariae]KAI4838038.1 PIR protein [Plasmodium brasilianum]SCN45345.1 PIR protein [Plasmodium malariae]
MEGEKETIFDEILQELPSYKLYEKFKSEANEEDDEISCNIFNEVKSNLKIECVKLCNKVVRNFKSLLEIGKPEIYDDICLHYKYWVYEEIGKLFETNRTNINVNAVITAFNKLQQSLTENYRIHNCEYKFGQDIISSLNAKNNEKILYIYTTNYNRIRSREFCNMLTFNKYKKYLNAISNIYIDKKTKCCASNLSICPNLFLNCGDELNPSKISALLNLENGDSCNKLESIKETESADKNLDSNVLEPDILDSILFTDCPINNYSENLQCGLVRASSIRRSNENTVKYKGQRTNAGSSSSETRMIKANVDSSEVLSESSSKQFSPSNSEEKNKMIFVANTDNGFRWKYGKGDIRCLSNISEDDKYGLCEYMDELVKNDIFIKTKDSNGHIFKKIGSWTSEELQKLMDIKEKWKSKNVVRLELRQLKSVHVLKPTQAQGFVMKSSLSEKLPGTDAASNILQNIFFRISNVVALIMGIIFVFFLYFKFTPFGSCLDKNRKRKKRYRNNFAELNTQGLTRKFIKRTYRHSDRRRFSVVNIER